MNTKPNTFGAKASLTTSHGKVAYYRLQRLEELGLVRLDTLPCSIRVLLENVLRCEDGELVHRQDALTVTRWGPKELPKEEIPFMPARVIMQDFTGVPAVVDLAAMRSAMARGGGNPKRINPQVPVDLVIDHSVQVDYFGTSYAFSRNVEKEFERNKERYTLLRWAQEAFQDFRVVPPGTGIVHQVNLEYLGSVIATRKVGKEAVAFPDTLVGTDSHTTMINGLSIVGWGVGGIEAEAVLLGQPYYMQLPEVVGFKLTGALREGVTATDLVLTITEMLRKKGVVDKFVEFYGPGLSKLPVVDRATIANMSPEYGATIGFFPIDEETLRYLRGTGRSKAQVELVEHYAKAQGLFRTDATPDPLFSATLELDIATVVPSMAGPKRPQDRLTLDQVKKNFGVSFKEYMPSAATTAQAPARSTAASVSLGSTKVEVGHGAVVIAAITSCTNTSNPSVMVGAGLLAKKAVERGLTRKPWVKTSMAPGSQVVTDYLNKAGLTPFLDALGFHTVGYGCTTCIGNSGPLPDPIATAVTEHDLVVAAVLSGNRNFEGRVHPQVRANYLASPMLVVAYALAGSVDLDLTQEPLGSDANGAPVYLRDIWPSQEEIGHTIAEAIDPEMFRSRYAQVFQGPEMWKTLPVPHGDLYQWEAVSSYVQEPPFFVDMPLEPSPVRGIRGARALALLGDSITTDHISPAGNIAVKSPAGQYLLEHGVPQADFNTYGARRGNHQVMIRGTFGNIRLRNLMVSEEGDWTLYLPDKAKMRIFDASAKYAQEDVPLIVIAGKEYGAGSSRDWAAKGPALLGVRAAIAESFERIHRSNLIGMGVLPVQFKPGQSARSLGLTGMETYDILGIEQGPKPGQEVQVRARREDGTEVAFSAVVRINTPVEVEYYRNGGVLQTVLRRFLKESGK